MNKIITGQDLGHTEFKNLWELDNPNFFRSSEDNHDAWPQFKLRQSGSFVGILTNVLTPSRLYGLRKLFAWALWLFIAVLIYGTVYAYRTAAGEIGQIYFTLFFIGLYLLFFIKAGESRLRRWDIAYTKAVKTDVATHTEPAIISDGQDMLLANGRIFDMMGDRPIAAFLDDVKNKRKAKDKQERDAIKVEEREAAQLKKEADKAAAKQRKKDMAALSALGGGQSAAPAARSSARQGSLASRAANAARGTTQGDSLSSRAARAARGAPPRSSNTTSPAESVSVKIEGYTGSYWQVCATGLENNANYIATRMQKIRTSNPSFTKFRAVDNNGRVVDMG